MKTCTILVGLPGVGKTHYCYCETHPDKVVFSTDDVVESIAFDHCVTYDQAWSNLIKFAEDVFWRNLRETEGDHVIVDRTNLTVKSRAKVINILRPKGYRFEAVVWNVVDEEKWMQQLSSRPGKTISQEVIDRMKKSYVVPTLSEGFKYIEFLAV